MSLPDVPYYWQEWCYSCALACLRMALGFRFPERSVPTERQLGLSSLGTYGHELFQWAQEYDMRPEPLDTQNLEGEVAAAVANGFLVIAFVPPEAVGYMATDAHMHAVLILGMQGDHVLLFDPRRHTEDDPLRSEGLRLQFAEEVQRHLGELAARRIDGEAFLNGLPARLATRIERAHFFDRWYNGKGGIDPTANDGRQPGEWGYSYAAFMV